MTPPPHRSPRTIVCGVDFSSLSFRALDLSVAIARASGGTVHAIHVDEAGAAPLADLGLTPGDDPAQREMLRLKLERDLAARRSPEVTIVGHVEVGMPSAILPRAASAHEADLVVVGTHGRRAVSNLLLGSVAEHVIHTSPVSVVTVPHTDVRHWPFRTVVCATDFSEGARVALRASLSLLPSAAPRLHVLHVLEPGPFLAKFDHEAAMRLTEDLRRALDEEVERFAPQLDPIMRHVRGGIVFDEILAEAQRAEADLVVLGATGHTARERALLGSVTARVVRGCPVPVLVARSRKD
jgi:nucleotide-binding universal stress UspA family protein